MDRSDLFKRYRIGEEIGSEKYESYIVYDRLLERDKRLTIIHKDRVTRFDQVNLATIFDLFSNQNIQSMEYLFDWGFFSCGGIYILRDARSLLRLKQHLFLLEDIGLLVLDILIALFNIHRNNACYGKIDQNSIYYCFNRYSNKRKIHYVLSAVPEAATCFDDQFEKAQREDIRGLGITVLKLISKTEISNTISKEDLARIFDNLYEHGIDKDYVSILIELVESKHDALYYIRKLLDMADNEKYSVLKAVYKEILYSRSPIKHIKVKHLEDLNDTDKRLFIIQGSEGSGKTELLNYISQKYRREGSSILMIDPNSEVSTKIGIYNNIYNYIHSYFPNTELTQTESSYRDLEHQLFYALSLMKDKLKLVMLIDNIEYAEPELKDLIRMVLHAKVPLFITRNTNLELNIDDLAGPSSREIISIIDLGPWNDSQIMELLAVQLAFFTKECINLVFDKLDQYGIKTPREIVSTIFKIYTKTGIYNTDKAELQKLTTSVISGSIAKKSSFDNLNDEYKKLLITIYLYPCEMEKLSDIMSISIEDLTAILSKMKTEGHIHDQNGIFVINEDIICCDTLLKQNLPQISITHGFIAEHLIREAKRTRKYSPLLIAEHLFKAGKKSESAAFYFNAAINYEKNYNFDLAIKYYNIALSLYKNYKKDRSKDKVRKAYQNLFDLYIKRSNFSRALQCLKSLKAGHMEDYDYYKKYADYYHRRGNYKKAISSLNKAKSLINGKNDIPRIISIQTDLTKILIEVGKYEAAYKTINEVLALQKEKGTLENRGYLINLFGIVHMHFGSYDKAEKLLLESAELEKNTKNYLVLPLVYNNLGIIYSIKGDYNKSLVYYERALEISLRINDVSGIGSGYHNIGILQKITGELNKAESYFMKAKIYHERANLKYGLAKDLQQLGSLYTLKGELNRAFSLLKESMRSSEFIYDKDSTAESLEYLGMLYFFLGSYQEAIQSLDEAIEMAEKTRNQKLSVSIHTHKSLVYLDMGNFENAIQSSKTAVFKLKKMKNIKDISLNYAILELCRNYLHTTNDHGNTFRNAKALLENEVKPISKFRITKLYLDYMLSLYYSNFRRESSGREILETNEKDLATQIIGLLGMMKNINISDNSRYYGLYYEFYNSLISVDIKHNKGLSELMSKAVLSLDGCIDKDYSELIWRWEFVLALCYNELEIESSAKQHLAQIVSRLESNRDNLPMPCNSQYINAPFRTVFYERAKKSLRS